MAIIRDGVIAADLPLTSLLAQFREDRYEVTVAAAVDPARLALSHDVSTVHENGTTRLVVPANDHRALYGVLDELRELDLPIESVSRAAPDLEEVFVRLLAGAN